MGINLLLQKMLIYFPIVTAQLPHSNAHTIGGYLVRIRIKNIFQGLIQL